MPHDLTTAPVHPSPKWPSGYIVALREMGAPEKTIPLCIRWVRSFFAEYPGRRRLPVRDRTQTGRDLGRGEIEAFPREVAGRPRVANWQVQQAREALEVYYERFRGIALAPRAQGNTDKAEPEAAAVAAQRKPHPIPPGPATDARSIMPHLHRTQDCDMAGQEAKPNPCGARPRKSGRTFSVL